MTAINKHQELIQAQIDARRKNILQKFREKLIIESVQKSFELVTNKTK